MAPQPVVGPVTDPGRGSTADGTVTVCTGAQRGPRVAPHFHRTLFAEVQSAAYGASAGSGSSSRSRGPRTRKSKHVYARAGWHHVVQPHQMRVLRLSSVLSNDLAVYNFEQTLPLSKFLLAKAINPDQVVARRWCLVS